MEFSFTFDAVCVSPLIGLISRLNTDWSDNDQNRILIEFFSLFSKIIWVTEKYEKYRKYKQQ